MRNIDLCIFATGFCAGSLLTAGEDHTDYIDGPFENATQVTAACLDCHEEEANAFMTTAHWTWKREQVVNGKLMDYGKEMAMNNYCSSTITNRVHCSECHAGYGWEDETFDFTDQTRVDCLICHDTTGTYHKDGDNSGWPTEHVKLLYVAQNVGKPVRQNCNSCHALGGSANNAKHGDISLVLDYPDRSIDVHMDAGGLDFNCQDCHETENHQISGGNLATTLDGHNLISCEQCHDSDPHGEFLLNTHTARIACQTCHIPVFAKEDATQMHWDWSQAGLDEPPAEVDGKEKRYRKPIGFEIWKKDVQPSYAWFNGKAGVYLVGDKIDPEEVTKMAYPLGDINDPTAKIHPFKIHTGKQVYDVVNKYFITNHIYGEDGFWTTFDWDRSIRIGMEANGMDYSGEYGFAPTEMYWRIDHMVSPKEEALTCLDCHGDQGRMDWEALGYPGNPMLRISKAD